MFDNRYAGKKDIENWLCHEIDRSAQVEILGQDEWSVLFIVYFKGGGHCEGIAYRPQKYGDPFWTWEIEDEMDFSAHPRYA